LSASEPRVVRVTPASIEVSSPVEDSGVVTYEHIDDTVYVAPVQVNTVTVTGGGGNDTIIGGGGNDEVANTTVVVVEVKKPAMVRVITDGNVEYFEADFVSNFYMNNKEWVESRYGVPEFSGFRAGDTTAVFDVTLTSKVAIPEVQSTPAEVIVVTTTIDPPQVQTTSEPYIQITDANAEEASMTRDNGGGKYVEDFSYMQY